MANNNNIKGISVEIGADSSKFAETLKNITKDCGKLQNELARVNKALKFDPESAVLAAQKQEILKEAAEKTAEKLELLKQKQESMNKALNSGKISGQEYREFQREIESTRSKLTYYNSELQKSAQAEKELAAGTGKAKEDIQKLSTETVKAQKSLNNFAESSTKAKTEVRQIGEAVNYSASKFETLDSKLNTIFKGTLAGFTGKKLVDYFIGSNADFEQYTTAFTTTLGSAEKAKDLMNDIADFAAETPLSLESLAGTAQILQAYGVAEDEIINKMQTAGDLAQGQADKMDTIAKAYGKMFATQKADWENLKIILEAGVPILQTLADQYGVTTAEMQSMISKGTVGMADLDKALQSLTTGNGQFAGAMKAQSETMSGMLSTLNDSFVKFGRDAGEKAFEKLKGTLQNLMEEIERANQNGTLDIMAEEIGNALNILITAFTSAAKLVYEFRGALVAGAAALGLWKGVSAIIDLAHDLKLAYKLLTGAVTEETVAQQANNVAMASNPIGLIVTAIGALIAIIGVAVNSIETYKEKVSSLKGQYDSTVNEVKELEQKLQETNDRVSELQKKGTLSLVEQQELEKLKETNSDLEYQLEIKKKLQESEQRNLETESVSYADEINQKIDNKIKEIKKYQENLELAQVEVDLAISEKGIGSKRHLEADEYYEYWKSEIDASTTQLNSLYEEMMQNRTNILGTTEEGQDMLGKTDTYIDKIAEVMGVTKSEAEQTKAFIDQQKHMWTASLDDRLEYFDKVHRLGEMSDEEYYRNVEENLTIYKAKNLEAYKSYAEDVIKYQNNKNKRLLEEQKTASEKMAAENKQRAEAEAKAVAESWEKEFEAVSNEAIKAFDKISDKRESLEDKLSDSVTVSVEEDDEYKLTDLEAETEKLKEYQRLREELLASTNEEFVTETFDSMSVDEAGKYASSLLSNRDGLQQYLTDWQEQQAVISEISMNAYKEEADNVKDYFFNEIGEKLSEMPDITAIAGKETAEKYADSACEALRQKMAEINASMMDIYYNPKLNPNFRYNGTSDYEYGRVTSQTPKVIKETVHMPVGDIVIQVDGQNLVTRTLNELRDQVLIHGRYSDLF